MYSPEEIKYVWEKLSLGYHIFVCLVIIPFAVVTMSVFYVTLIIFSYCYFCGKPFNKYSNDNTGFCILQIKSKFKRMADSNYKRLTDFNEKYVVPKYICIPLTRENFYQSLLIYVVTGIIGIFLTFFEWKEELIHIFFEEYPGH